MESWFTLRPEEVLCHKCCACRQRAWLLYKPNNNSLWYKWGRRVSLWKSRQKVVIAKISTPIPGLEAFVFSWTLTSMRKVILLSHAFVARGFGIAEQCSLEIKFLRL